jgi:hypothetical protein
MTLEITEPPPMEISVIASEVIYQLRPALDHIFFRLNPSALPRWEHPRCHSQHLPIPVVQKTSGRFRQQASDTESNIQECA